MTASKPEIVASKFVGTSFFEHFLPTSEISHSATSGKTLAFVTDSSPFVFICDLATKATKTLTVSVFTEKVTPSCVCLFHAPGAEPRLVVGYSDGTCLFWDRLWDSGTKPQPIKERHKDLITSVAFAPGGERFYAGDTAGTLTVCQVSVKGGKFSHEEHTVTRYPQEVSSITIDATEGIQYGAVAVGESVYSLNLNEEDCKKQSFGPAPVTLAVPPKLIMMKLWSSPVVIAADR